MPMSKQNYVTIAKRFAEARNLVHASELSNDEKRIALSPVYDLVLKLSNDFALDNDRFDRQRFLKACGVA